MEEEEEANKEENNDRSGVQGEVLLLWELAIPSREYLGECRSGTKYRQGCFLFIYFSFCIFWEVEKGWEDAFMAAVKGQTNNGVVLAVAAELWKIIG